MASIRRPFCHVCRKGRRNVIQIIAQPADSRNYRRTPRGSMQIRYIVLHGIADGETARQHAAHAASAAMGRSLHYYVDQTEVQQSVHDRFIAWHCGTRGVYYHPYCRNENSIGVALCGQMQTERRRFAPSVIHNAQALVRALMARYDIPAEHVLRHYDVTHKTCPAPFVECAACWTAFQTELARIPTYEQK